jgi:hypothetical protein
MPSRVHVLYYGVSDELENFRRVIRVIKEMDAQLARVEALFSIDHGAASEGQSQS